MTKTTRLGISQRAFARKMGVLQRAVVQKIENGRLTGAVLPDGSLDEALATKLWKRNTATQMKRGPAAAKERARELEIKLERAAIDLKVAEHKLEKLKASVIDRAACEAAAFACMVVFRRQMESFAKCHGPAIASALGLQADAAIVPLDRAMKAALAELAGTRSPFGPNVTFGDTANV